MPDLILDKLFRTPSDPGVYLMKDADGKIIYIGKARNLKNRVSSYFKKNGPTDLKTGVLVKQIAAFDTIITATEKEALILESTLIKRHRPRYNVILKDDKRYPSLRLEPKHPYPCLTIVRKPAADGALYFGPFPSARAVRQTLNLINKTFRLRKCSTRTFQHRTRPCLNYQIGACLAPCCRDVAPKAYADIVKEIILFLKGRTPALIRKIKKEMSAAARRHDFENAAVLRDRMFALEKTLEKQVSVTTDFVDRDILAVVRTADRSLITLLIVRGGYLLGTRHIMLTEPLSTKEELMEAFIRDYYDRTRFIPKEILLSVPCRDAELLEHWLSGLKGQKVNIVSPRRGGKVRLIDMARKNAEKELADRIAASRAGAEMLARLQHRLKTKRLPTRIECFDNSSLSGRQAVSGMVVFTGGRPDKSAYRKYRIRHVARPDDYAYMAEVLRRRYTKTSAELPVPDLLLIDGGKGQLNVAISVLKELKLEGAFDLVAIAKKEEARGETKDKIYKPGRLNPVNFGRDEDLLLFLERIRDETHRYAISFHRQQRSQVSLHSIFDTIPGIGPKRKKMLLSHFESLEKIRAATLEELCTLPGINRKIAENLHKVLSEQIITWPCP